MNTTTHPSATAQGDDVSSNDVSCLIAGYLSKSSDEEKQSLARTTNGEWENIFHNERKRRFEQKQAKVTSLFGAMSDKGIETAYYMAGNGELQWEFSHGFERANTEWHCTGDTETLVQWLLSLQASPKLNNITVGYIDPNKQEDYDEGCFSLTVAAAFCCPSDLSRLRQVYAVVAWVRAMEPHDVPYTIVCRQDLEESVDVASK